VEAVLREEVSMAWEGFVKRIGDMGVARKSERRG